MNYCVIGDVHGEYKSLVNLVAKTPTSSELIFVGDLVDRGSQSAHVVRFIRKHKLISVLGNHEVMMIENGTKFIEDIENNREIEQDNIWLKNGGKETLLSYGLIYMDNDEIIPHPFIKEFIFQFKDDIEWMKELPLYLELDAKHVSGRKVVVSHSAIAPVWRFKDSSEDEELKRFSNMVLWGRVKPMDTEPIFNIFGHTPRKYTSEIRKHYINLDTGCYIKDSKGYGVLSAYCVETEEIYTSSELVYERAS